jgi:hypothetical protein
VFSNDDYNNRSKWRRLLPHTQYVLSYSPTNNDDEERLDLSWVMLQWLSVPIYFKQLLAKIKRQFQSEVMIVRLDMETGYVELLELCRDLGIAIKARTTEAQSKAIERAGKSIVILARAIRLHSDLPKAYANECAMSAIYLGLQMDLHLGISKRPYLSLY